MKQFLCSIFVTGIIVFSGCGGSKNELQKEAKVIAEIMCKSLESMKNLRMADPSDSLLINKLQADYEQVEKEMTILYQEFRTKYGDKINSKEFNENFRKFLNEAMLNCKTLSREDRETFEKGMK